MLKIPALSSSAAPRSSSLTPDISISSLDRDSDKAIMLEEIPGGGIGSTEAIP